MAIGVNLEDKPWHYGFGIGLLLALVILGLTHYYVIRGINERIAANQVKLDELATKIAQGRTAEKQLPQFREQVKRLEDELEKLRRILPSSRNTEEIIGKIKALVDEGNFLLGSLTFPPLSAEGSTEIYKEWPIKVKLSGNYHDLAILFNRLSNFSRIMNVEQFTLTALPNQATHTLMSEFVAKTFVYVEPTEPVADEKADETKAKKAGGTPGGGSSDE